MALQKISAPMRGAVIAPGFGLLNLQDAFGATQPGWTTGATLIDGVPISPALTEQWTLTAWGFTFLGAVQRPIAEPSYGKLGAVWAGLLTEGETPTQSANPAVPSVTPMRPLPPDITTFQKVWDGTNDPVFPAYPPNFSAVAGAASQILPQPIPIDSGRPVAFGLWLTPSLALNTLLQVWSAKYSLVYDDGLKEPMPL